MLLKLTDEPIDPASAYCQISKETAGSVVLHFAVVKEQRCAGGVTCSIEYSSAGDSIAELESIAAELQRTWKINDLVLLRRTGCLGVGDVIALIATSSPNSEDAFEACKLGVSLLKKMTSIKKNELYR